MPISAPAIQRRFAAAPEPKREEPSAVEAALARLDPDILSPKEALQALYELKTLQGKAT